MQYYKNIIFWQVLLITTFICSVGTAWAQRPMCFKVMEKSGAPIANIQVRMEACGHKYQKNTDKDGKVAFTSIQGDSYKEARIIIKTKFYMPLDTTLNIGDIEQNIILNPNIQQIEEVRISAYKPIAKTTAEKSVFSIDKRGFMQGTKADFVLRFLPGTESRNGNLCILGKS